MRKADNLPPYSAVVKKSRSLNFLEPSGPPMALYGGAYCYRNIFDTASCADLKGILISQYYEYLSIHLSTALVLILRYCPEMNILGGKKCN